MGFFSSSIKYDVHFSYTKGSEQVKDGVMTVTISDDEPPETAGKIIKDLYKPKDIEIEILKIVKKV